MPVTWAMQPPHMTPIVRPSSLPPFLPSSLLLPRSPPSRPSSFPPFPFFLPATHECSTALHNQSQSHALALNLVRYLSITCTQRETTQTG
eukprot:3794097-Rhodomonas_salina.1